MRKQARSDLIESFEYLELNGCLDVAQKFKSAFYSSVEVLLDHPLAGKSSYVLYEETKHLRVWKIKGFKAWMIFYLPTETEIQIVRVLHGRQNLISLFDEEEF